MNDIDLKNGDEGEMSPTADIDGAWKEAFQNYLEPFFALCLPEVHREIDWSRGFEFLDKELAQIAPESETGRRYVDLLVRVYRRDGDEQWVLVHIEVQAQRETGFPLRMYTYNYRILDRYAAPVVSVAVLADDNPAWRPDTFTFDFWGCRLAFQYPIIKLTDYVGREAELEATDNPFAVIILAHLKAMQTVDDAQRRAVLKLQLTKGLYRRGWDAEKIRQLFRIIDWMVKLPKNLEIRFRDEIDSFEQENRMPYVTSIERLAFEEGEARGVAIGEARGEIRGLIDGVALGLRAKYSEAASELIRSIEVISDLSKLREIYHLIDRGERIEVLREAIIGRANQ